MGWIGEAWRGLEVSFVREGKGPLGYREQHPLPRRLRRWSAYRVLFVPLMTLTKLAAPTSIARTLSFLRGRLGGAPLASVRYTIPFRRLRPGLLLYSGEDSRAAEGKRREGVANNYNFDNRV
ncbi:hypothetical protein E2C01_045621 [Portunus trituberculatus]|uniref:Uncharacterized protein n=1 Tax=Portunus trituberculatus TaxID=210409 RepID=A0A5B7G2J9_PORTR|nr:hypothetical protein [Portunus trituberculatus]